MSDIKSSRLRRVATVSHMERDSQSAAGSGGTMSLGGLVFVGIGGIIGAGYFLGVGLAIQQAGPGILIGFLIGALIMSQVLGAIMSLAVNHPVKGSFRTYAEELFGPFLGYFQGWSYWLSGTLTLGSEAIAMSVFARMWLPQLPVWLLASVFTALVIVLNVFGVKSFTKMEGVLSGLKIAALVVFCVIVLLVTLAMIAGPHIHVEYLWQHGGFLPHGIQGVLQSMLIVIFAYAGIGVVATASTELKRPRDAGIAAIWVVLGLALLYLLSLFAMLLIIPWWRISVQTSPFVAALSHEQLPFFAVAFNAVILVAAFSVMAGALFANALILRSMASAHEAPSFLDRRRKGGRMISVVLVSGVGAFVTIGVSYLLPSQVYGYLISAASYFTFFNWVIILLSWLKYKREQLRAGKTQQELFRSAWLRLEPFTIWLTLAAIVLLATFSLGNASQRMGGIAALLLSAIVGLPYPLLAWRRRKLASRHDQA